MNEKDIIEIIAIVGFLAMGWFEGYCAGKKKGWVEGFLFMSRMVRKSEMDE